MAFVLSLLCARVYWPHAAYPVCMLCIELLYIHVKAVIMYHIFNYVCMHIGRIQVSNVHTISVHCTATCDIYPY